MHALDEAARRMRRPEFNRWARELGRRAFDAFTYTPPGGSRRRLYWKMSIDLSRPLVPSMGQHDPLDGYVTYLEAMAGIPDQETSPNLEADTAQFASMLEAQNLGTADPLGLGGLLLDAFRLTRLPQRSGRAHAELLQRLLSAAHAGLAEYMNEDELRLPAARRLAFRELGLAIGLRALSLMPNAAAPDWRDVFATKQMCAELAGLARFESLAKHIEAFWVEPAHRQSASWTEHRDINDVMLATSLVPSGYLGIAK